MINKEHAYRHLYHDKNYMLKLSDGREVLARWNANQQWFNGLNERDFLLSEVKQIREVGF